MINPIIYHDEIFRDIDIPEILPYYQISNYGTVVNKYSGLMISIQISSDGYARVPLYTIYGKQKSYSIHRLVMMTFHPINGMEELEINHKNGIKLDNRDTELEWVTHSENMLHAYRTGLNRNRGENNFNTVMTESEVRYICDCLSKGIPFRDIANSITSNSDNIIDVIRAIYTKRSWSWISKDYTFYDYGDRKHSLTEDDVKRICDMMQKGYKNSEIAKEFGYDIKIDRAGTINFRNLISTIRNGKCYQEISKDYTFDKGTSRKSSLFTEDQVHKICSMLEKDMSYRDILLELGLIEADDGYFDYEKYSKALSAIKNRVNYCHISNEYNF